MVGGGGARAGRGTGGGERGGGGGGGGRGGAGEGGGELWAEARDWVLGACEFHSLSGSRGGAVTESSP